MQPSDPASSTDTVTENIESVGDILREAREALGEDIRHIARVLRINRRYLEALEQGRFKDLPGNTYAIGFIRSYAEYLSLDGAGLIARYKEASEAGVKKTQLDFPEPIPETGLPGGAILFAGLVVAVLAYGGWYMATEDDNTITSLVAPVPERLAEDAGAETETTQSDTADAIDQNLAAVQSVVEETEAEGAEVSEADVVIEEPSEEAAIDAAEETADEAAEMTQETEAVAEAEEIESSTINSTVDIVSEEMAAMEPEETAESVTDTASAGTVEEESVAGETMNSEDSDSVVEDEVTSETVEDSVSSADETEVEQVAHDTVNTQALNEAQLRAVQESMGTVAEDEVSEKSTEESETETGEVASVNGGEETSISDTAPSSDSNTESNNDDTSATVDNEPRVYGEEGDVRIVIMATANSWAEVRDTNSGELLLTRLLKAGDSFRVPDRKGIVLVTGNAGGLEITVDGAVAPAIGDSGHIRRDVALEPELLLAGEAAN